MSQQPESEGVQSLKAKHDNVPSTDDSSDSVDDELWTGERLKYYLPLHNAAKRGDWERAKSFIDHDPNALTAQITVDSQTALHVAAYCCQWGFILKLLELLSSPESIAVQDEEGSTVLHYVAQGGSLKTAKALVKKNAVLIQIVDSDGDPPLLSSISSAENKELVWYLSLITRVDSPTFPFFIPSLPRILYNLIQSGYYGKN
ncbi:hypothetical protein QYF36_022332 [Acer negundo]|nr:hypothetical protein QYF36_022332 [Acer negundo]